MAKQSRPTSDNMTTKHVLVRLNWDGWWALKNLSTDLESPVGEGAAYD